MLLKRFFLRILFREFVVGCGTRGWRRRGRQDVLPNRINRQSFSFVFISRSLGEVDAVLIGKIVFSLQKGIGLKRFFDGLLEVSSAELQQFYGLLQLRGEGKLLSQFELERLFHTSSRR